MNAMVSDVNANFSFFFFKIPVLNQFPYCFFAGQQLCSSNAISESACTQDVQHAGETSVGSSTPMNFCTIWWLSYCWY